MSHLYMNMLRFSIGDVSGFIFSVILVSNGWPFSLSSPLGWQEGANFTVQRRPNRRIRTIFRVDPFCFYRSNLRRQSNMRSPLNRNSPQINLLAPIVYRRFFIPTCKGNWLNNHLWNYLRFIEYLFYNYPYIHLCYLCARFVSIGR